MAAARKRGKSTATDLDRALEGGDVAQIRKALLAIGKEERELLVERLGAAAVDKLLQNARRSRAGEKRGRVVVVNGIMGAKLDVVDDESGNSDRVWVNYWRLFRGRMGDLELDLEGRQKHAGRSVRVAGLFPEYLPMVAELDRHWHVLSCPFDWRVDIDISARRLAESIQSWAHGEPVHIVAHSMGGLVSRRMCALFPDVWKSMRDPEGRGRGGRLVMLGTPNQGSFAISLVFTGEEGLVKKLAMLDTDHDLDDLLAILATFPGCYQMLPSPARAFGDDRMKLFERATWGSYTVHPKYLDLGRSFQSAMAKVIDPERLVYVAGYGQETAYRIYETKDKGKFRYLTTYNGDGRVPHDLGLLDGVRTLWVNELHGDLAKNEKVLEGIHDILGLGTTNALEHERPAVTYPPKRAGKRAPGELVAADPEFEALAAKLKRRGGSAEGALSAAEEARLDSLLMRDWVGSVDRGKLDEEREQAKARAQAKQREPASLDVEVVWGDITRVEGDVYAVGHYANVLPQNAEAALDRVVSGPVDSATPPSLLVLRDHTRRGVLSSELGKISFYPWFEHKDRLVAVACMGHPGSFGRSALRRLANNLASAVATLPHVETVCTVLIGAGAGNLSITDAVFNLLWGIADAIESLGDKQQITSKIKKLRIVERDRAQADAIHREVLAWREDVELSKRLKLKIGRRPTRHGSAQLNDREVLRTTVAAVLHGAAGARGASQRRALSKLVAKSAGSAVSAARVEEVLSRTGASAASVDDLAARLRIDLRAAGSTDAGGAADATPMRLSCTQHDGETRVSLLTDTSVIPERTHRVDPVLINELVQRMTDPEHASVPQLGALLGNLVLPRDFRDAVRNARSLVVAVDRETARIHWEMLCVASIADSFGTPLARTATLARQLRTGYSPAPTPDVVPGRKLKALVVGDPGDPKQGDDLEGARREALAVAKLLRRKPQFEQVDVLVGAPSAPRTGLAGTEPASRLDVLERLIRGGYDLLHYCGHGSFDPEDPSTTGWVFEGGLLTAQEIERVDLAPRLIVANACLSGLTSSRVAAGARRDEAGLLPSLADEFFHRGVRNYVGTAWEISDEGAIEFATTLYDELIPDQEAAAGKTLGEAIAKAREQLAAHQDAYDALWAAYQHYGDPSFQLAVAAQPQRG